MSQEQQVDPLLRPAALSPGPRIRLAGEIVGTYCEVRWRMAKNDILHVLTALHRDLAEREEAEEPRRMGLRIGRSVQRTLSPLPFDSRCLMRSLVLLRMLARRGVDCTLVIGVRPGASFEAHAWVEYAGRPLLPTLDYQPLTVL